MEIKIPVAEIFGPTLQGEGPDAGKRVIFVRVMGCNFNCEWCDSKFTWKMNENTKRYTESDLYSEILYMCKENNCNNVVLTGGNPCLYNFSNIIKDLHNQNINVAIETQGEPIPTWLNDVDTLVFSPKPPSSKQKDTYDNITKYIIDGGYSINQIIAIKIPVFNEEDIEFARTFSKFVNHMLSTRDDLQGKLRMYLSIGNSDVEEKGAIRDRILTRYEEVLNEVNKNPQDFENVFILPQIHTLIWGNKQRSLRCYKYIVG